MQEDPGIQRLKEILLTEERGEREKLVEELGVIREEVMVREKLEPKIRPIIEERLDYLQEHFPEIYGKVITDTIKRQIRDSRDEVVDALYPIVGRLIQRFVKKEIEVLSARVDEQVNRLFSMKGWWHLILGMIGVKKIGEDVVSRAANSTVDQAFLVDRESGLLLGNWAQGAASDPDMVAGMMTAIKSFAEDALGKSGQQLEMIEYDTHRIFFLDMRKYYFAIMVSGAIRTGFEDKLTEALFVFAEKNLKDPVTEITGEINRSFSALLEQEFIQFNAANS